MEEGRRGGREGRRGGEGGRVGGREGWRGMEEGRRGRGGGGGEAGSEAKSFPQWDSNPGPSGRQSNALV